MFAGPLVAVPLVTQHCVCRYLPAGRKLDGIDSSGAYAVKVAELKARLEIELKLKSGTERALSALASSSSASTSQSSSKARQERTLLITASGSHLDLGRAPYALYGVKYIDLVSLLTTASRTHII